MARPRLCELLWTTFTHKGEEWRVILTTPNLIPKNDCTAGFRRDFNHDVGLCAYDTHTIYIDAGLTEDELGYILMHELFHVGRKFHDPEGEHVFFQDQTPIVWGFYKQMGIAPMPPLPDGWKRLRRSSRIWRGKREWS